MWPLSRTITHPYNASLKGVDRYEHLLNLTSGISSASSTMCPLIFPNGCDMGMTGNSLASRNRPAHGRLPFRARLNLTFKGLGTICTNRKGRRPFLRMMAGFVMNKKLVVALLGAALGLMLYALPGRAQKGFLTGGGAMHSRGHVPMRGAQRGGYLTGPRHHPFNRRYGSAAYPYLYPYYDPDYYPGYSSGRAAAPAAPATRVVVVQTPRPRAEAPPPPPPESLVLELQGNHWVRITSSGRTETASQSSKKGPAQASSLRTITPQQSAALEAPRELPPAVLVFRDGHKEEITRYTIVGGTIYTNEEYWNSGSWTKKVPLAELNVPATLELNRERGARFTLPSGPGQIVVRP